MSKYKLIVWLGNVWEKYTYTKHNVGFLLVDKVKDIFWWTEFLENKKFLWYTSTAKYWKYVIILLKPTTYMNLSWNSVVKLLNYYKIKPFNMLVICDDLDIEVGKLKLKWNWWTNWHNWIKSIDEKIWTNKYWKLKMWIWRPSNQNITWWVLGKLQLELKQEIEKIDYQLEKYVKQFLVSC